MIPSTLWRTRIVAASAAVSCACGYTSTYVPPDGWRARPLYHGNEVIMVGPSELPRCVIEGPPAEASEGPPPPMMGIDDHGDWSPRVHVVVIGRPPIPPHWIFLSHGYVPVPPGPHNLFFGSALGGAFKGGGGGGGGKGAGMVMAFLAAVAVAASAGIAVGLAADPPEDSDDVAKGIDAVNTYNDQARTIMAECMRSIEAGAPVVVEVEAGAPVVMDAAAPVEGAP